MLRLFQRNKIRQVEELEGDWDFQPIEAEAGLPSFYEYRMPVPGCWELHPQFSTYQGKGAYRTTFKLGNECNIRLVFKGISHTGEVFLNGVKIGSHYNAYTPFELIVPSVAPGEHELAVIVDNTFNESSALHVPNDYYTYGGIIRPVAIEKIPNTLIDRIEFVPTYADHKWSAKIKAYVKNIESKEVEVHIKGKLGTSAFDLGTLFIPAESSEALTSTHTFPDVISWSGKEPQLYMLELKLFIKDQQEPPVDDLIERVGFRTVTTERGAIQINGEDIVFKGFNRHEDHPLVGSAIPYQLMVQDMELMLDMGGNAVRTSHYPNDERFLDLCDERGVYVWEENHARGLSIEQMRHPLFAKQCEDCNQEMVESHFNHPSIIIWAILMSVPVIYRKEKRCIVHSFCRFAGWIHPDRLPLLPTSGIESFVLI